MSRAAVVDLGQFITSSGFGGLAALVAALLAFRAAILKLSADREVARQNRWWDSLSWIYDRATHERLDQRLPPGLALDLFDRLLDEAHTELELQTAQGLLEGLFEEESGGGDPA